MLLTTGVGAGVALVPYVPEVFIHLAPGNTLNTAVPNPGVWCTKTRRNGAKLATIYDVGIENETIYSGLGLLAEIIPW